MSVLDEGSILVLELGAELVSSGTETKIGCISIETDALHEDPSGKKFRRDLAEQGVNWLLEQGLQDEPGQARVVGMRGLYGVSIQPLKMGVGPIYGFVANRFDCRNKWFANVEITRFVPDLGLE
jgi:hypothetical protein